MSAYRKRVARGFMLIEIMVAISLLAVFALIATKLLVLGIKVPHEVGEQRDAIVRFDSVVTRLRDDVWQARSIKSPDEKTLEIQTDSSGAVTWRIEAGAVLRTGADAKQTQRWELKEKLGFSGDGAGMVLNVAENAGRTGKIQMLSERMLLESGAQ
jgi:prepilin-type N-terminal cleavage/methylation domain-containing protein